MSLELKEDKLKELQAEIIKNIGGGEFLYHLAINALEEYSRLENFDQNFFVIYCVELQETIENIYKTYTKAQDKWKEQFFMRKNN